MPIHLPRWMGFLSLLALSQAPASYAEEAQEDPARALIGLWKAQHHFGPEIRGRLVITRRASEWSAEIAHESVAARMQAGEIAFDLAGRRGSFRGHLDSDGKRMRGHWIQPAAVFLGYPGYASPVSLERHGPADRWTGEVAPLEDHATLYLVVQARDGGGVTAFLRDPQRNLGTQFEGDRLWLENEQVELTRNGVAAPLLKGALNREKHTLSFRIPAAADTPYEFVRADAASDPTFLPRGADPRAYQYHPPRPTGDGWQTATLEEVGIARKPIVALIDRIARDPVSSLHSPDIHAVLIARHGKLVLEEYFHGRTRETTQDTRSATKSIATTLVGAAMLKGIPIAPSSPVYRIMQPEGPSNLDPYKTAITLEHLMTMSSGLECDDWNPTSRGNEDVMRAQTVQPDWVEFTLNLPVVSAPGKRAAYCGGGMNLAGAVLRKTSGRPVFELFDELLAEPLQMGSYHMNLTPTGDAFMAGGSFFRPRDFMKLAQVMLNGGSWNGRRIVSAEWAQRATAALVTMPGKPEPSEYGYGWWVGEFPTNGRTVHVFSAAGNGGEFVYGIPALDLVVAFYGGNYYDATQNISQYEYIPRFILPAIK
jgi:CubicO group peptidase (beta-lactamase class C family)